jgi:hypothetical protein
MDLRMGEPTWGNAQVSVTESIGGEKANPGN